MRARPPGTPVVQNDAAFQRRCALGVEMQTRVIAQHTTERPIPDKIQKACDTLPLWGFYRHSTLRFLLRIYGFAVGTDGAVVVRTLACDSQGRVSRIIGGRAMKDCTRLQEWRAEDLVWIAKMEKPGLFLDPLGFVSIIDELKAANTLNDDLKTTSCDCCATKTGHSLHTDVPTSVPNGSSEASAAAAAAHVNPLQAYQNASYPYAASSDDPAWFRGMKQNLKALDDAVSFEEWTERRKRAKQTQVLLKNRYPNDPTQWNLCGSARCLFPAPASRCACQQIWYCSPACQKFDFKWHKHECTARKKKPHTTDPGIST